MTERVLFLNISYTFDLLGLECLDLLEKRLTLTCIEELERMFFFSYLLFAGQGGPFCSEIIFGNNFGPAGDIDKV